MDGQHTYEIVIHKGDLLIELSSDDLYFISKQMDKWFRILLDDSYVPTSYFPQKPPAPEPAPAPVSPPPPQADLSQVNLPTQQAAPQPIPQQAPPPPQPAPQQQQPAPQPPVENQPQAVENFAAQAPQPQPQEQPQPQAQQPVQPQPQPAPPPVQNPVQNSVDNIVQPAHEHLESPVQEAVQPALPLQQQPAPQPPQPQPVQEDFPAKDDFEKVMDSLMEDLEGSPAAEESNPEEDDFFARAGENGQGGHGREMEVINSLADLCSRGTVNTNEDYLMLSAYYLTYFEALDKFSLKRVNSLMVQSGLTPVNHSVLETALSKGLLSMVPDMTGTAEMSEYALTNEGQSHAERLI